MNWIKSNPFVSGLAGITILLCGILYFLASKWGTQFEEAKAGFEEAYMGVTTAESIPLYPTPDLRDGKSKALSEHREAITDLAKLFDKYRAEKTDNISPQAFKDRLLAANDEVTKAFDKTELPEKFLLGFESYQDQLAKSDATGTLLHPMDGIRTALLGLAKARPSALIKIFREPIPEEEGEIFQPAPNDVARHFSCEVTFKGSEQSVRKFLNALGSTESHYFIIRTLKIMNDREAPPQVTDAKFEKSEAEKADEVPVNPFGPAFFEETDSAEEPAEEEATAPSGKDAEKATKPKPEATPAAKLDTSRILAQVLGNEELTVFVRFDIALFLPSKELPKP